MSSFVVVGQLHRTLVQGVDPQSRKVLAALVVALVFSGRFSDEEPTGRLTGTFGAEPGTKTRQRKEERN